MTFPTVTAFYAAVFAIIYIGLSVWVIAGRLGAQVLHGDGGNDPLLRSIRAHGNFAEYVPFALILIGLIEGRGGSPTFVRVLLLVLVVARVLHPIGMLAPKTDTVAVVAAVALLLGTN